MSTIDCKKIIPMCETVVKESYIRSFLYWAVFAAVLQIALNTTVASEPFQEPSQEPTLKLTLEMWKSIQTTAQQKGPIQPGSLGSAAEKFLPRMRELLPDADVSSKLDLARAIWQISGKAADSAIALAEILGTDYRYRREDAVYQFHEMGSASFCAFPAILALSKDPRDAVRECAINVLGAFGPEHKRETEEHLLDATNDKSLQVRLAASEALVKDGSKFASSRAIRILGENRGAARQTAIPIAAKLSDRSAMVRIEAIKALGKLGKEANFAAPALAKFLFTSGGLTSFPSGSGIGRTEQFSAEALLKIGQSTLSLIRCDQ